jgi:hypothetical protein
MLNLFTLTKVTAVDVFSGTTWLTAYSGTGISDMTLTFDDNPSNPDLWTVPRRTEHLYVMNTGGVNIDFGLDRSKQDMKMTVNVATQSFTDNINGWYLNDVDQLYILTSHKNENWITKWKDLNIKYISTLPDEFIGTVPLPIGMPSGTPFSQYADVYELGISFFVVDYNIVMTGNFISGTGAGGTITANGSGTLGYGAGGYGI